jgi:hypothetical protein
VFSQLYRILERHLTSTGVALVAMQRGAEHAGVSGSDKAALFVHTVVAPAHVQPAEVHSLQNGTSVVRVAKRAIM